MQFPKLAALLAAIFLSALCIGQDLPNYALAAQLASKAQANVRQKNYNNLPLTQDERLSRNRNSAIDNSNLTSREAGCGAVALGNVRPMIGDHRQHNVTVVVTGNIINSGSGC